MKNPLNLQLKNLPHQGWAFHFDRQSQDLNRILKDLIGESSYSIDVHIQPIGESAYKIKGVIDTQLDLLCSRCAYEFKHKIYKKFSENIIVQKKQQRKEKEIRINHYSEQSEEENFTLLEDKSLFHLGQFLYELILIEEPLRPLGYSQCDQNDECQNLKKSKEQNVFYKNTNLQDQLSSFLENQSSTKDSDLERG